MYFFLYDIADQLFEIFIILLDLLCCSYIIELFVLSIADGCCTIVSLFSKSTAKYFQVLRALFPALSEPMPIRGTAALGRGKLISLVISG